MRSWSNLTQMDIDAKAYCLNGCGARPVQGMMSSSVYNTMLSNWQACASKCDSLPKANSGGGGSSDSRGGGSTHGTTEIVSANGYEKALPADQVTSAESKLKTSHFILGGIALAILVGAIWYMKKK